MIAVVDIGNSNIVIGLMDDDRKVRFSGRIRSDRQKTKEEFMIELKTLMDIYGISFEGIQGVILSSVVPVLTDVVFSGMKQMTGMTPYVVGQGMKTGIRIATDHPASLGADLVVDAVAAVEEYEGPFIIFDMGTATTCSVVDEKRTYLGTLIIPGIKISQDALTERTAQLPYIRFEKPKHIIGKNTIESMQSGVLYGNAAMIDGLIDTLEKEIGRKATVLATGGIAGLIVPYCRHKIVYEPDLLLKGLWYIFHKNAKEV
ncbi:MAG: type III pantothenate kinase [Frisingicoccus sp.]|nr:type III pantothenate kinase [Frisingicoccus sp.]